MKLEQCGGWWGHFVLWLVCSAAVLHLSSSQAAPDTDAPSQAGPDTDTAIPDNPPIDNVEHGKINSFEIHKRMFLKQRQAHHEAVKSILAQNKYDKRYQLIKMLFQQIFEALSAARVGLMGKGYLPGDEFPTDPSTGETLSMVAENVALLGDILLRMPDIGHDILKRNKEWDMAVRWGTGFCNDIGFFTGTEEKLLHLMSQELGLVERDPNYNNPYKESTQQNDIEEAVERAVKETLEEAMEKKRLEKKAKKEKKKKGPRLSSLPRTDL